MSEETISLKPILATPDEVEKAREGFSKAPSKLRSVLWPLLLLLPFGALIAVLDHDWKKLVGPTPIALVVGFQWFRAHRIFTRRARDLHKVERLFSMTRKGLVLTIAFDEEKPTRIGKIPWQDIVRGEQEEEAVVIRYKTGEFQRFPNDCFSSPEDRATLLRMVYGKGYL